MAFPDIKGPTAFEKVSPKLNINPNGEYVDCKYVALINSLFIAIEI